MTNIDPKIIARIQKMQALARDGGATEGEANNAAEMAQRLMMEHNISEATLAATGAAGEGKRAKDKTSGKAMYDFQQKLMREVGRVNFCHVTEVMDWKGNSRRAVGYNIIGREANVAATLGLFDYLNATTERLAFEYVDCDNKARMSRAAVSFKRGMAERLVQRLAERHERALEAQRAAEAAARAGAASGGTGLVVMDNYAQDEADANDDMAFNREPGTTARLRFLGQLRDEAQKAARSALRQTCPGIAERAICTPVATAAVDGLLMSRGFDPEDAELTKRGVRKYAIEWAVDEHVTRVESEAAIAGETDKQRAAREAKEQRENERFWNKYRNQANARDRATDHSALRAGRAAGDGVGLDTQVGGKARKSAGALS